MRSNASRTFDQFNDVRFIKRLVSVSSCLSWWLNSDGSGLYYMERQRVDDCDLSKLIYSNEGHGWQRKSDDKAEYLSTSHSARKSGSTVTFRFNGTSVQVKGTIFQHKQDSNNRPYAEFALDSTMTTTFDIGNPSDDPVLYQQTFYNSPALPAEREHFLTITLFDPDMHLWIDYIEYIPVPGATVNTPATLSTPLTDDSGSISKSLVTGVSVPAAVMIVLIVALVWWKRRRMKGASAKESSLPMTEEQFLQVRPYPISVEKHTTTGSARKTHVPKQNNRSSGSGPSSSNSDSSGLDPGPSDREQPQEIDVSPPPYRETA
ncbi:hypothetical protein PQX77_018044 [Marasmius sp. AFHP31]|nr:hypothetical protein PQX77_018044 [Marasmius sp. AFHP31]